MIAKLTALLVVCLLMAAAYTLGQSGREDRFSQRSFPCHEDEVLGYSPTFGPDDVGCMNIDPTPYGEIGDALSIEPD